MDFTYKKPELEIARYIKLNPPTKIWRNFVSYTFDYGNFYFQLVSECEEASTPNKPGEAIVGQLTKHLKPFHPNDNTELVCDNKKVEEVYIVRTFLYFSAFHSYSKTEQLLNRAKYKVKSILFKTDPVNALTAKATGYGESYVCHPNSEEAKKVNAPYSNIIDCGLILQIDGNFLFAFVQSNGYGFPIWNNKNFHSFKDLEEIAEQYELIGA